MTMIGVTLGVEASTPRKLRLGRPNPSHSERRYVKPSSDIVSGYATWQTSPLWLLGDDTVARDPQRT